MANPTQVWTDYGEIEGSSCSAHYIEATNGNDYVIKGTSLSPNHLYVAANEWVASQIAQKLGVPTPDFTMLQYKEHLVFARQRLPAGELEYRYLDEKILARCCNRDEVYILTVFDAFVCNLDRHEGNLLVREKKQRGKESQFRLIAIDHDRCLVPPGSEADILKHYVHSRIMLTSQVGYICHAITDVGMLSQAILRVEQLTDEDLDGVVKSTPVTWWRDLDLDPPLVLDFLRGSRDNLRDRFQADRKCFNNLGEGDL